MQFGYRVGVRLQRAVVPVLGAVHLAPASARPAASAPARNALTEAEVVAPVARVHRRAALHARQSADLRHRADRRRLGHRRRRGADPVQHLRRAGLQPRTRPASASSGDAPASACSSAAASATGWGTRVSFARLQAHHRHLLHRPRRARTSSSARCAASDWALFFIGLSRAAVAVSSVLNFSQLLRHVSDEYRGRVFATMESMVWSHHDDLDDAGGHRVAVLRTRAPSAPSPACSAPPPRYSGAGPTPPAACPSPRATGVDPEGDRGPWRAHSLTWPGRWCWSPARPSASAAASRCAWPTEGARVAIHYGRLRSGGARAPRPSAAARELFRANLEKVARNPASMFDGRGAAARPARRPGQQRRPLHPLRSRSTSPKPIGTSSTR